MPQITQNTATVELRAAKIPWLSLIAVHYWFVVDNGGEKTRWEVWQKAAVKAPCWGHLHQDLLPPTQDVGCGDSWVEKRFSGDEAKALMRALNQSPKQYPYTRRYHYWPGPNSNTYVQWILEQAGISHHLHPTGIGKHYRKDFGHYACNQVNSFYSPLFGWRYQAGHYIEVQLLQLSVGICFKPFRLRWFIHF